MLSTWKEKYFGKFNLKRDHTMKPLKWFFAYKEDSNPDYINLIKVAVTTAKKYTNLEPYCVYEGNPSELSSWLLKKGVKIINHKCHLSNFIIEKFGNDLFSRSGMGALLRVDLPVIILKYNIEDKYILYTDCDVMFYDSVDELSYIRPKYFALVPESYPGDKNKWKEMNTGVMIMNVKKLYDTYNDFVSFIKLNISKDWAWDQTAYNIYYKGKITRLPEDYNWRPYWGDSTGKKILHFHGPKPFTREHLEKLRGTPQEILYDLYDKNREMYHKVFEEWDNILSSEV